MTQAARGDTVHLHYTGTLSDGTTFDSSKGREPLVFQVGAGQIIKGLDAAIPGMAVGETKKVEVACDEAYGPVNPGMRQDVPRSEFPKDVPSEIGTRLQMRTQAGDPIPVTIVESNDKVITLDANHPLAGKDLIFDIELVSVQKAA